MWFVGFFNRLQYSKSMSFILLVYKFLSFHKYLKTDAIRFTSWNWKSFWTPFQSPAAKKRSFNTLCWSILYRTTYFFLFHFIVVLNKLLCLETRIEEEKKELIEKIEVANKLLESGTSVYQLQPDIAIGVWKVINFLFLFLYT